MSNPRWRTRALFVTCLASLGADHAHHATPAAAAGDAASFQQKYDVFTNFGTYLPRTHCLLNAQGNPDWPWIGILLALNVTVIVGYLKIFRFWRRCHLAEAPGDRDHKLMDLAHIFLLCAACGYGFFILTLFWPAYRLLAVFMIALSFFTWRFATDLDAFRISFSARRLHRELHESLQRRNDELEATVAHRTAELERAVRFRGDFLANMSHELRTPMTAILGFADLLAEPGVHNGEQQAYVETIRRNGQHLLGLVNDVLDLSKIEAGKLRVESTPCDVAELTHATVESFRPRAATAGLTLAVDVAPGVPRQILTDPLRFRQILTNLVGNAMKFTQRGGVTVRLSMQARDGQVPRLQIDVIDTGCGVSETDLSGVFDRFGHVASDRPRGPAGSGLGLTISRNLARLMGGDLVARSVAGEGSTFTVTVDAGEVTLPPAVVADAGPGDAAALVGLRVLVAEDVIDTQAYLRSLLTRWGASVELVDNGRAAVERGLADPAVGLVLMDVQMPVLDGLTATKRLREGGYGGPIVALTANALVGDRDACLAAGCTDYAAKPIHAAELLATIGRALSSETVAAGASA